MQRVTGAEAIRSLSRAQRAAGRRVALVPTMGSLHQGHLSLVREARRRADWVVVSIFVNPTQFGPGEDLENYPRDLERDAALCAAEGVDALFVPDAAEVYPTGYQTSVRVDALSRPLCGASRPGHFDGVATVVAKLLIMVEPDMAVFGEKDYQQLQVIRRLVADLNLPAEIVGAPIVRDADGLALSSRNAYLSDAERCQALCLSRGLDRAEQRSLAGPVAPGELRAVVAVELEESGVRIDYVEALDPATLGPAPGSDGRVLLAIAAFVGPTRLIDNRVLPLAGKPAMTNITPGGAQR